MTPFKISAFIKQIVNIYQFSKYFILAFGFSGNLPKNTFLWSISENRNDSLLKTYP